MISGLLQNTKQINFGRALTTKEKQDYCALIADAKKALDIKDTTAIVFDFSVPSKKGNNTAIGSTWSDNMHNFSEFLSSVAGITSIQVQPQGKIDKGNFSPYSGTNFALGTHITDLSGLAKPEFADLISEDIIRDIDEKYAGDKHVREFKTDYEYVLGNDTSDGIYESVLKRAYGNFNIKLKKSDKRAIKLNKEFSDFKRDNINRLLKEALFEVLKSKYETSCFNNWDYIDSNLFSKNIPDNIRSKRISELSEENQEKIDYENFKQFIAYKQQKNSRRYLNSQNIKLYGDCLIGFSQSELWADKDCFKQGVYYGGPDPDCTDTSGIQTWNLAALDYTKLGTCRDNGDLSELGETGKFLFDKYSQFFKRYDGIRMDAAWQFVTPFIYEKTESGYKQADAPLVGSVIFNIMNAAAKSVYGEKYNPENPDNIMLELVGISAGKSRELTKNKYPHLYTTAYAEYDETPAGFKQKGYNGDKFYIGTGCHDNDSLVNMAKDEYKRNLHLAGIQRDYNFDFKNLEYKLKDYKSLDDEARLRENYRTAKFAEIFTSPKQFFTLTDMFGMSERINISGKIDKDNWRIRIPCDFEHFYFSQLSKGFGLNLPKALSNALFMRGIDNKKLIEKCNEAAEILRASGPLTQSEADIADKNGGLKTKFEYLT